MKLVITSLLTGLALLVPTHAVVTLPFGTVTQVDSQAYVTGTIDPNTLELVPRKGTFSVTFRVDATQDVYLSRHAAEHASSFLVDGDTVLFVPSAPRAFLGFPSNTSDNLDWLFLAAGNQRTFQLIADLAPATAGNYAFYLEGLHWTQNPAGTSWSTATINYPDTIKTNELFLAENSVPEPSRMVLTIAGLALVCLRRRR